MNSESKGPSTKEDVAESRVLEIKVQLITELAKTIERRQFSQIEVSKEIGVDQPKVSALLRGRVEGFTIDRLIRFLVLLDQEVNLDVRPNSEASLADHPTRWSEIIDPRVLCKVMDARFHETAGPERYFRMTATPIELKPDRVNTADMDLRAFVQFPMFGQRQNGWHLGLGQAQREVLATPLGLESRSTSTRGDKPPLVTLTRSGHFEFSSPLFPWICFNQTVENYHTQPRLYPTAILELPISFLRFIRELYRRFGVGCPLLVRIEYRSLGGCILFAGLPSGLGAPPLEGPKKFSEPHYGPYEQRLENEFDIDAAGLKFALDLYRCFGYERVHIPYFQNDKFNV